MDNYEIKKAELKIQVLSSVAGAKGEEGESMYEIAKKNGFEGTEQEFIAQYMNVDARIGYYECDTDSSTSAKTVQGGKFILPIIPPYGGTLKVKFKYKNSAANPTLSISGCTAKPLYYDGARASESNTWADGETVEVYYDGANFQANNVAGGGNFATGEKVRETGIDAEPTAGSNNLVKSGGVFEIKRKLSSNVDTIECYNKTAEVQGTETSNINFGTETFYASRGDLLKVTISGLTNIASRVGIWIDGNQYTGWFYEGDNEWTFSTNSSTIRFGIRNADLTGNSGTVSIIAERVSIVDNKIEETKNELDGKIDDLQDSIDLNENNIKSVSDKLSVSLYETLNGHIESTSIVDGGVFLMISIPSQASTVKIVRGGSGAISYAYIKSYNTITGEVVYANGASLVTTGSVDYTLLDLTQKPTNSNYLYVYRSSSAVSNILIDGISIYTTILNSFSQVLLQNTDKTLLNVTKTPVNGQNANLSTTYIPNGSIIRITVDGVGTAIKQWYYVLNGTIYNYFAQETVELQLTEPLNALSLRTNTASILDSTKNVTWKVELVSQKTFNEERFNLNLIGTNNLFNPYDLDCKDNYSLKSTDGNLDYNNSYWVSGFISIDSSKGTLFCTPTGLYKASFYDESKTFISEITSNSDLSKITVPSTASFIRLVFSTPFDSRTNVKLFYSYKGNCCETHQSIDTDKVTIKDRQYFRLSDILQFASDENTHTFTASFSITHQVGNLNNVNMILSCFAKYITNDETVYPTIKFYIRKMVGGLSSSTIWESSYFEIGGNGDFENKEWRIPPLFNGTYLSISVTIPTGVTLYIDKFENYFSDKKGCLTPAYRADGHITGYARFCTKGSFYYASKFGFPCCIAVPKRTSDGIWVCFHDEAIDSQLVDSNNQTPQQKYSVNSVSDLTFAQLQEFTYSESWFGYKDTIPTLEYFFMFCAKTGMEPMLSVHPTPTESEYLEIRNLADKIGVLKQLNLKPLVGGALAPAVHVAFNVMGNDIGGYIIQAHGGPSLSTIISAISDINVDKSKVRWGIEFYGNEITLENVSEAKSAGLLVSCTHTSSQKSKDMEYWMKNGVTEWTEDRNISYGLNW